MPHITFQSEQPSDLDVFPGGSHDKVATAICDYVIDDKNSRIVGLDGEFGSGKSSILKMLEQKLDKVDQKYKVWFFDCEQNYQGSIKSNFIELFTDELIEKSGEDKKACESLKDSRDRALGRQFTYTKNTVSRVSTWALILVVSLFFSTSSFKELFAIAKLKEPVIAWIIVHIISFLSPLLVLFLAHRKLKNTKVGDQPWSIYHLFKGGSDDTITEKIKVAKEVTPLDLKRTLENDLKLLNKLHYIVILDNLDRLPKDSLRAVWSDLEIFTWVTTENNLTVIVPFCSNKVASYLTPESEQTYDSRDFIAKKFPVVFRAPPIIAAGWKDGFYQLYQNTFPNTANDIAEKCALLLQRHSPMRNKLVTPRLQKRFINDIATTSLTMGPDIELVCIGAYLLLCKYNELPLEQIIRTDGLSETFKNAHNEFDEKNLNLTKKLLEKHVGHNLENGWQIQFLQIHFLTTRKIAMAELIDEPLALSIEENNDNRFAELVSTFGFTDAFKRYLSDESYDSNLIRVLAGASKKISEYEFERAIRLLNEEAKSFVGDVPDDADFFDALKTCRLAGLSIAGFDVPNSEILREIRPDINEAITPETLETKQDSLQKYDHLIDALGIEPDLFDVDNAAYFIHIFSEFKDLKSIERRHFKFTKIGRKSIHEHIVALPDSTVILPITEKQREILLEVLSGSAKNGHKPQFETSESDILFLSKSLTAHPNHEAILFGLALSRELPDVVVAQILAQPAEDRTPNQKAALAAILLSSKKTSELLSIEDLESIVESNVFKLLFRGSGYSDILTTEYANPDIGKVISKILAWAIKDDAIWTLNHRNVSRNFSSITSALLPYGIEPQKLFDWLNDWQRHFKAENSEINSLDEEFVLKVTHSTEGKFDDFKKSIIKLYSSDEFGANEWEHILLSENDNHTHLIRWALQHEGFALGSAYQAAIISIIKKIVTGHLASDSKSYAARGMTTLVAASDQTQRNLLGNELRNIIYTEDGAAKPSVWVLKEFGNLIVDIQPASTAEVGKLMSILDYLNTHTDETKGVLIYLEGRAKQLSSFSYSEQLRDAMALAISKHVKSAPKLYQAFARKSVFKKIFRQILNSERNGEQDKAAQLKADQNNAHASAGAHHDLDNVAHEGDEADTSTPKV